MAGRGGAYNVKHGMTNNYQRHPLYTCYYQMLSRCYNTDGHAYYRYGGRGIHVCKLWREDKCNFFNWALTHGWKQGLQLDRKNNNLGYSPSNCRFVTPKTNSNNRCNTRLYREPLSGLLMNAAEIAKIHKISRWAFVSKIEKGMSIKKALQEATDPAKIFRKLYEIDGKQLGICAIEREYGCNRTMFRYYINKNKSVKEAIKLSRR